ncbi:MULTISPECIES: MFS transporter [unclassified Crossiella]|uniref:MFS transporter n=1 Tax=unclassified Crossiella TaxID=2620835 RepID=UPI001FFE803E|nr:MULTISPECIES: MFS transporter [unclassified Crossiella]MCK2238890.1 MFS transporter [Crossiella sp. S99.2]MCK2251540.1 MFS transporter [Crossiella sp. S99.1]
MSTALAVRPAYREPAYLRYLAGHGTSLLGDQVWHVALSYSAVQLASPGVAGLIMTVASVPRLALMLLGGALADRFDARRLMIGSDLARTVVMVLAAVLAFTSPSVLWLVLVALAFGIADAVFLPAAGSLQPRLLELGQLSSGAALNEVAARAALLLGAPLGGVLVAVGGLPLACVVNAVTFVLSMVAVASARPRREVQPSGEPMFAAMRSGFAFLRGDRVLRTVILAALVINLGFVGPMNLGIAVLAEYRGWGSVGIGLLVAGFGGGAALGALVLLRVHLRTRLGLIVAVAALAEAVAMVAMAVWPSLPVAVFAAVLVGLGGAPCGIAVRTLMQARTPDAFRGRVSSVHTLCSLGIAPLAIGLFGLAVDAFGVLPAYLLCAALELIGAILCLAVADLRRASIQQG